MFQPLLTLAIGALNGGSRTHWRAQGAGGRTNYKSTLSMKNNLVITLLSVAAFAVGCKQSDKTSPDVSVQAAAENVETKTRNAVQASNDLAQARKEYAYAQKAEFVTEKQTQLAEIDRDLIVLSNKLEAATEATKADAKPKLQALREQSNRLNKQLDAAKAATESTWDSVKAGSIKAYDELKDGFQTARQWASEKIAP